VKRGVVLAAAPAKMKTLLSTRQVRRQLNKYGWAKCQVKLKNGVYIARLRYFIKRGRTPKTMANKVVDAFPGAVIIKSDVNSFYYEVRFTL
jgi:hypothetical protein